MAEPMSDPIGWSLSVGRYFNIRVRLHLFFLLFLVIELIDGLRQGGRDGLRLTFIWESILFASVLLHEFGHCFAARAVGGDADDILMWPLGGLATVQVPHTARAHFITTVCGPLVNVVLCLMTGSVMMGCGAMPPLNPFSSEPVWAAGPVPPWLDYVVMGFEVNWMLFLFNLIPAFPMDGGRMLRSLLWGPVGFGFARSTMVTVQVAKLCAIALGVTGVLLLHRGSENFQLIAVAFFVYVMSEKERRQVEEGLYADETFMGYDFSQGYTSLATSSPKPKARRMSMWERWRRRREKARREREAARERDQEKRVDEILDKIQLKGIASLTDHERRTLRQASEKAREKKHSRGA
jgi:Zn-dependent protease